MKRFIKFFIISALAAGALNATTHEADAAHSSIGFTVKPLKISKVTGNFKAYNAVFDYDRNANELKSLEATIKSDSVNTQNQNRDKHLIDEDFLDTQKFPEIKFKMTKFQKDGASEGKVYGDLTVKNITKPVVLDFEYNGDSTDMQGKEVIGISLDGEILRTEFKVGESDPDITISNKINLNIEIEAKIK